MSDVVFVDTETTGLDPDRHEIWEVGLIYQRAESDEWTEASWQLPVDLGRADAFALSVGQFHIRRRPGSLSSLDAFSTMFAKLTRGKHLAGAVVSFDEERLRKLLRANGACPEWHYHLIDVEALAVGYLNGQGYDPTNPALLLPWDSEMLSHWVGVDPDTFDRHTALGDARWAKAVYEAVTNET